MEKETIVRIGEKGKVELPEGLLEGIGIKSGDIIEFKDRPDGTIQIVKSTKVETMVDIQISEYLHDEIKKLVKDDYVQREFAYKDVQDFVIESINGNMKAVKDIASVLPKVHFLRRNSLFIRGDRKR